MEQDTTEQTWEGYNLHEGLLTNFKRLNYIKPTDIQNKVLDFNASKTDLVVQARTGEGKTLCFGIPIVDYILKQYDNYPFLVKQMSPIALIITPTRELGIQIKQHLDKIIYDKNKTKEVRLVNKDAKDQSYHRINVANVLGGFAKVKQLKILKKYNPEIIVATPGRLWEIIDNEDTYINFKNLKFFVIDEADRMMEKHHFSELKKIIKYIYTFKEKDDMGDLDKNKLIKEKINQIGKDFTEESTNMLVEKTEDELNEDEFIRNLLLEKGIKNAVVENVEMTEILDHLHEEVFDNSGLLISKSKKKRDKKKLKGDDENKASKEEQEEIDEEENEEDNEIDNEDEEESINQKNIKKMQKMKNEIPIGKTEKSSSKIDKKKENLIAETLKLIKTNINLRTILCSATIEIKSKEKNNLSKAKQKKDYDNNIKTKKPEKTESQALEGLIKNLKFYNKLVYLKLDPNVRMTDDNIPDLTSSCFLPSKLKLEAFKCEADNKDYYLYHLLTINKDKSIIVFTNSISHTKKLHSIFSYFDFNIKSLHSKMQQKQRITRLDKFRKSAKDQNDKQGNVLFCTDIGARGLDIPEVDIVIHYHIPLTTENFVHRSGRTARALKDGQCLSLVSGKELNLYKKILRDLKIYEISIKIMPISQLDHYKSLFKTVRQVEKETFQSRKNLRENEWLKSQADLCDIIPDDNLEEEMQAKENDAKNKGGNADNFLGRKRQKAANLNYIENKKLQQKILHHNISKSSYIDPNTVKQLNSLLSNNRLKVLNLTETLRNAHAELEGFKKKKAKRTRHVKRKQGK